MHLQNTQQYEQNKKKSKEAGGAAVTSKKQRRAAAAPQSDNFLRGFLGFGAQGVIGIGTSERILSHCELQRRMHGDPVSGCVPGKLDHASRTVYRSL
jgi:hypothetical protein